MNKNRRIIQIIRPTFYSTPSKKINMEYEYTNSYLNLIKNVDLSCCGVFIELKNDKISLKESCKNGIIHCLSKTFEVNNWSQLYNPDRTTTRSIKLNNRGWKNLSTYTLEKDLLIVNRSMKLNNIEFNPEYDYKIWTEEEYKNRKGKKSLDDFFSF